MFASEIGLPNSDANSIHSILAARYKTRRSDNNDYEAWQIHREHKERKERKKSSDISANALKSCTAGQTKIDMANPKKRRKYSAEEKDRAREMYRNNNLTVKELAQTLGMPNKTLNDWITGNINKISKSRPQNYHSKGTRKHLSHKEKEQAVKMYYIGNKTLVEVARKFKVNPSTVSSWCRNKEKYQNNQS